MREGGFENEVAIEFEVDINVWEGAEDINLRA